MFTLRQQHQSAFQTKAEADFVREVMNYLRENHADTFVKLPNGEFKVVDLPEKTLQKMVEGGIAKARNYEIERRQHLISFIVIMFVSAPNFDEHSKVSSILNLNNQTPAVKFESLWIEISDEHWEEVGKKYDSSQWI